MGLGTKNRQNQTAELCREHLRSAYPAQSGLVEDFILETEGSGKTKDPLQWAHFTNLARNNAEMFGRLDVKFRRWLNGEV